MTHLCRYQGVNWRDKTQWHCNSDESPYKESHYDGINVDPLEVLFVKVGGVDTAAAETALLPKNVQAVRHWAALMCHLAMSLVSASTRFSRPACAQVKEQLLELRYGATLKAEKYDAWSANAAAAAASLTPKQRDVIRSDSNDFAPETDVYGAFPVGLCARCSH